MSWWFGVPAVRQAFAGSFRRSGPAHRGSSPVSPRLARSYANTVALHDSGSGDERPLPAHYPVEPESPPAWVTHYTLRRATAEQGRTPKRFDRGSSANLKVSTRKAMHISRTGDGLNYDFQSAGEFVLLCDENLKSRHARYRSHTAPLAPNSHTALRPASADGCRRGPGRRARITYQPNISGRPDPEWSSMRIDGKTDKMSAREILLDFRRTIVRCPLMGAFRSKAPGGPVVVITPDFWSDLSGPAHEYQCEECPRDPRRDGRDCAGNWLPALPDGVSWARGLRRSAPALCSTLTEFVNAWR